MITLTDARAEAAKLLDGNNPNWHSKEWMLPVDRIAAALVAAEQRGAESNKAVKWEADHQRRILETHGLAEEFPFGCDAIDYVATALLEARSSLVAARAEADAAGYERGLREAAKIVDEEMILAAKSDWPQAAGCLGAVSIKIAALLPAPTKEPT